LWKALIVSVADDEDRVLADVVAQGVADVRDVFFAASHLPDALPDLFLLEFVPFTAGVRGNRNVGVAHELPVDPAQNLRHGP
jgi:hypothetical protein